MNKSPFNELPIRSKVAMIEEIAQIIGCLHRGKRGEADRLMEELKVRSLFFGEEIQQDVLIFAGQVYFQYDYDPWHCVTHGVQQAADRLIEDLGFRTDALKS